MMEFNSGISRWDRTCILVQTGVKAIRGFFVKMTLNKAEGILLVGRHVKITHRNHISCGKWVKFEDYSEIQGLCKEGLRFGDYVTISRGVMIRPSSYYGTNYGVGLEIGDYSAIGPNGFIGCSGKIKIGNNVMFGSNCILNAENHVFDVRDKTIQSQGVKRRGITIEDDVWIGSNVIILDGVIIGRGSVIGAGTLVNKDIPPYSIVVDKRQRDIRQR